MYSDPTESEIHIMTKSEGMYPQADPTAPGGMSKANLRTELAEKHGITMAESREISWPDLIQEVIDGRLARERFEKELGATDSTETDDLDDLLAEFEAEADGATDSTDEILFDPEALYEEIAAAQAEEKAANPPLFLGIPGIEDYVFAGHAGAGPSASERWMHCTMSLSASRAFLETLSPNQQRTFSGANLAARQGTTAHAVGEAKANHMLGRIDETELQATLTELAVEPDEGEEYDDEMEDYVNEYVDLIKSYADERGAEHILIESRVEAAVPLAEMHEGEVYIIRGSADCIVMPTADDPTLIVADLKYGEGIHVDAESNSQAMLYALGALGLLVDEEGNLLVDVEKITLVIAQPRLGGIKTWDISLDDLLDWQEEVLSPALTQALYGENEGATYNPSVSACQFCPARGGCPALTQQRVDEAADLFDVIVDAEFNEGPGAFPETTSLSNDRLGELLAQVSGLIDLHKDLKEEAQRRLHRGAEVPGFKLVNYTPPRKWTDDAAEKIKQGAVKGLTKAEREALFKEPTLLTPKQAITVLGEKGDRIEGLYESPEKRPVVAPSGDRRSKWEGKPPEAMFEDESTDEDRVRAVEEMFPDA